MVYLVKDGVMQTGSEILKLNIMSGVTGLRIELSNENTYVSNPR